MLKNSDDYCDVIFILEDIDNLIPLPIFEDDEDIEKNKENKFINKEQIINLE